jgi:hypothetical protein
MRMWFDAASNERNHNGTIMLQFIPDICGAEAIRIEGACYNGLAYDADGEAE